MYRLGEDKNIRDFLEGIREELPEDNGYFVDRFILNEYRNRKTLEKRTRSVDLDQIVMLYNKSTAKYKKIFAEIYGLGFIELTKKPDLSANEKEIGYGKTICFQKKTDGEEKKSSDFIALHTERFIEKKSGKDSDIYIYLKGITPIKITP